MGTLGVPSLSSSVKQVVCVYGKALLAPFFSKASILPIVSRSHTLPLPWSALDPMSAGKENNNIG